MKRECRNEKGQPKIRFATRSEAKARAKEIAATGEKMHAYKCSVCEYFHLGHEMPKVNREARKQQKREESHAGCVHTDTTQHADQASG